MKRIRSIIAAVLVFAISNAALAESIDPPQLNLITFENRTGQSIDYLYVSPGDSAHWSTDILGAGRVLNAGESIGFYIDHPNECDAFDFMGISGSSAFTMRDYQICERTQPVVSINSGDLSSAAPYLELAEITIINELNYPINYLFFSPADSMMWGVNQLDGNTILNPGDSVTLLLPVGEELVGYDVQAIDQDQDSYTFQVQIDNSAESYWVAVEPTDIDY